MIRRYTLFGKTLTIASYEPNMYTRQSILKEFPDQGYKLIKDEGKTDSALQVRYSLFDDQRMLGFIRGYFLDSHVFHIGRIENTTRKDQNKIPGSKTLPLILDQMQEDLVRNGVEKITASSLRWLAPLVVEQYGFISSDGRTSQQLKSDFLRWLPFKAIGLEKKLIE